MKVHFAAQASTFKLGMLLVQGQGWLGKVNLGACCVIVVLQSLTQQRRL